MWTENDRIRDELILARNAGLSIRHRISIPDFERFIESVEGSKDKPHHAYAFVKENEEISKKVQKLINDLISGDQHEPFENQIFIKTPKYMDILKNEIYSWALKNGHEKNIRFAKKEE